VLSSSVLVPQMQRLEPHMLTAAHMLLPACLPAAAFENLLQGAVWCALVP
jgi:hypothetical protein